MTDRKSMDRPAAVTAFALGVVLILISIPLLASNAGGATTYTVSWSQSSAGSKSAQSGAAGATTTVQVDVSDVIVSNATVSLTCNDNRGPGSLAAAATVSWTLKRDGVALDASPNTSCADKAYAAHPHPDVAETKAKSASAALANAYDGGANMTHSYVIEFSWTRPGGTGPLPVPPQGTSFTATIGLEVQQWTATVNEKTAEVGK